jgi:hypothetical protein
MLPCYFATMVVVGRLSRDSANERTTQVSSASQMQHRHL